MEERNMTTRVVVCGNHEVCRRDLSQGMRCTQTCATTQSEQTLMVPIEAPPLSGLRINYTILNGDDDEEKDMQKKGHLNRGDEEEVRTGAVKVLEIAERLLKDY
jgi:hypothetical protein